MKPRHNLFLGTLFVIALSQAATAAVGSWSGIATSSWDSTASNWTGVTGTPWDVNNGPTNTAIFNLASLAATVTDTVHTNGITFTLGGSFTGGVVTLAGTVPFINVATTQTATFGTTDLAGTAGLVKTGDGILSLGSEKNLTGGVQVDAGTLRFTTGGGVGANTITLGAASGSSNTILEWANNSSVTNASTVVINPTGGTKTLQTTSGVTASISNLTLNGNVTKSNAGILILTNAGSHTSGSISITSGTLQANSAATLPCHNTSGGLIISGGTIGLPIGGTGWTTSEVNTLLANATKTSGSVGIDTTAASLTQWTPFTASNFGVLGLVKNGNNTLTLGQSNSFTGGVTVNGGTLRIAHSSALGTGTKVLSSQGGSRIVELFGGVTLPSSVSLVSCNIYNFG